MSTNNIANNGVPQQDSVFLSNIELHKTKNRRSKYERDKPVFIQIRIPKREGIREMSEQLDMLAE